MEEQGPNDKRLVLVNQPVGLPFQICRPSFRRERPVAANLNLEECGVRWLQLDAHQGANMYSNNAYYNIYILIYFFIDLFIYMGYSDLQSFAPSGEC